MTWKDFKHWEVRIGRWALMRWCDGAPCSLTNWNGNHSVRLVHVRTES